MILGSNFVLFFLSVAKPFIRREPIFYTFLLQFKIHDTFEISLAPDLLANEFFSIFE